MKLAVNTLIFGLNGAVAEGLVLAERNGIDRALAYDVLAASAAGAPFVGYKRAAFVDPDGDAGRLLAGARREGPAAHRRAGRAHPGRRCRRPTINLEAIRAAERSIGARRRLRQASPVICVRRAGDDRSAMSTEAPHETACPRPSRCEPNRRRGNDR